MTTRPRILIVDDQPANIRVMAEALGDGYDLFFATSGSRALDIIDSSDIELVLLDIVMPDLDGFEVCRRIKSDERTQKIPVVFVTAREEMSDEARGFDVGGVDYITKPIRPPIVRARVQTHIELKRARDLLEKLALVDPLTGIANRRRFDATLDHEWRRAARNQTWFSLALIDVDYFKNYNDTYGHAKGDECLQAIARTLLTVTRRPADLAARYGGEEFALILPDTDGAAAHLLLTSLIDEVLRLGIEHSGSKCGDAVSISAGVVSLIPTAMQTSATAVDAADQLLYEAKEGGRNRFAYREVAFEGAVG